MVPPVAITTIRVMGVIMPLTAPRRQWGMMVG
ncbi:hypothetical protein MBRU_07235 [Mycolicibacterium brumae DSM 44177]|nr:hypothetical protein MBRU_07235 [Mycolicibacterium brumae DSM 44177]